jgi:hypothetical protein
MLCEGGTVIGDLLIAGGGTLLGFAIGGVPGAIVGFGVSVLGIISNG